MNALILDVSMACKAIARIVAFGALGDALGGMPTGGETNVQGEAQKPLDVAANEIFIRMNEWNGHLAGMVSEEMEAPFQIPDSYQRGKYLLAFDPLDGSSNIDVNVAVGSIFSVLRAPGDAVDVAHHHRQTNAAVGEDLVHAVLLARKDADQLLALPPDLAAVSDGKAGAGSDSWLFVDEIIIE